MLSRCRAGRKAEDQGLRQTSKSVPCTLVLSTTYSMCLYVKQDGRHTSYGNACHKSELQNYFHYLLCKPTEQKLNCRKSRSSRKFARRYSIGRPSRVARSRAKAIERSLRSIPVTAHPRRAIRSAYSPGPHPRSSTRVPGRSTPNPDSHEIVPSISAEGRLAASLSSSRWARSSCPEMCGSSQNGASPGWKGSGQCLRSAA